MPFSRLPASPATAFAGLARWLHGRSAARPPQLLVGILFARGRRTATSWSRACGIARDFRAAHAAACAVGRNHQDMAAPAFRAVKPPLGTARLVLAIDDAPAPRCGPEAEGAGTHHNPTPGPAGERSLYGHVWVTLAALARRPGRGAVALPLQAQMYVRATDVGGLPPERPRPFRTKLEMAADQLDWAETWPGHRFARFAQRRVVVDGGHARRPFLRGARRHGFAAVSRLREGAALWSLPLPKPQGQPGPQARYGKGRFSLAKRAGQPRGWREVECEQYGRKVSKKTKTFLATWRPAEGVIRVVLVEEEHGWLPSFSTDPGVTAAQILGAMAGRWALGQTNKDVKEVWGAGQQQVRNVYSNEGCFNPSLWMYSLVEAWAWGKPDGEVCDRSASPWDGEPRRPSRADKRKASQREVLRAEIREALPGRPTKQKMRELAQRLLDLAA